MVKSMARAVYIYIIMSCMDDVHPSHDSHPTEKKELHPPGFELVTSGLAMEGLTTMLTHHPTKMFVS